METTDLIIVASATVAGTSLLKDLRNGKPHAAPIVFGFLLAMALLLIAVPAPKFSRGLSYLALIGAFAVNGPTILGLAAGFGGSKAPGPNLPQGGSVPVSKTGTGKPL